MDYRVFAAEANNIQGAFEVEWVIDLHLESTH
jgi:hypothetical protein